MVAGLVLQVTIWRIMFITDDEVGGSVPSGTPLYNHVNCRFEADMPQQLLLQQGLETPKMYTITMRPASLDIRERDEIEITWPPEHKYYQDKFRVVGVNESNFHPRDNRGYLLVNVVRSDVAHANV